MKIAFSGLNKLLILSTFALVTACGGGGGSEPEPPPIVIDNIPIAVDDTFTTDQDEALTEDVSSNDTGLQDAPVTYTVESAPGSGPLNLTTNGQFTFTPASSFTGEITFTYRVTDNDGDFDTATVTITVNEVVVDTQPVANDDAFNSPQDQT